MQTVWKTQPEARALSQIPSRFFSSQPVCSTCSSLTLPPPQKAVFCDSFSQADEGDWKRGLNSRPVSQHAIYLLKISTEITYD